MTITLILIVVALILIIKLLQPFAVIYLRQLLLPGICILFVMCLVLMSGTVLTAAKNGLTLWSCVIVPSLFPFFVAAETINATGFVRTSGILLEPLMRPFFNVPGSASFALAMGIASGYPVGAKITSDLRSNGTLTKTEAERLLAFTNNSGPLFIIGAVGTTMYKSTAIGLFLFVCHLAACITVGLLFRFYKRSVRNVPQKRTVPTERNVPPIFKVFGRELKKQASLSRPKFAVILGDAVKNAVASILAIGGFVVLFAVIIQVLNDIGLISAFVSLFSNLLQVFGVSEEILKGLISGLFEITTGSGLVSGASSAALAVKLPAASFIIGWAGLSVHSQVMSIISKTDISIRPYLFGKFLQGILAALYTWTGMRLFNGLSGTVGSMGINEGTVLSNDTLSAAGTTAGSIKPDLSVFFHTAGRSLWLLFTVAVVFFALFLLARFKTSTRRGRQLTP
jgi:sporulation integral membrane protein YlbJ